ncbi:MAG: hypothetical protein M0P43_02260 [Arcobacteraceae bacterium]|jgi:hypothetical protein|nr:hypothetical protein [Arcobacteraceae bacterium]MDY0327750.1 hypothetical protein [Arcobacteraceae bacterium]
MSLYFIYPNVFAFILVPLILLAFLIITNKNGFETHFTKKALNKLSTTNGKSLRTRNIYLFISLIFFIVALSQPIFSKGNFILQLYMIFMGIGTVFCMMGFYSMPKIRGE